MSQTFNIIKEEIQIVTFNIIKKTVKEREIRNDKEEKEKRSTTCNISKILERKKATEIKRNKLYFLYDGPYKTEKLDKFKKSDEVIKK